MMIKTARNIENIYFMVAGAKFTKPNVKIVF